MLMQLLHAHSTTVLAQARPTMFCIRLVYVIVILPAAGKWKRRIRSDADADADTDEPKLIFQPFAV